MVDSGLRNGLITSAVVPPAVMLVITGIMISFLGLVIPLVIVHVKEAFGIDLLLAAMLVILVPC
jgi:hypothetical protein